VVVAPIIVITFRPKYIPTLGVQQLGLTQTYKDNEEVRKFCGMLDGGMLFLAI